MNIMIEPKNVEQPTPIIPPSCELTVAIASLSIGGAERIVLDWAIRIYPKKRVHIIVLRNREKEWPVPSFIRVTRLEDENRMKPLKNLPDINSRRAHQLRLLGKEIAESGNPVCTCHLLNRSERNALIEGGAQVVTVLHNAKNGWPEGIECLSGSSNIIAVSDACAKDMRESGWDGPITVIRHIPPRREFSVGARETFRKKWNIPQDAIAIGMIGAIKPQKDYPFALRVLSEIIQKRNVYLVIIGGPVNTREGRSTWEFVVSEVQRLGLRNRVAMPGFIADAASCFPALDMILNTSHYEGLSIATLEALQSGMSVVASAVGGQGEIMSDGLTLMDKGSLEKEWAATVLEKLQLKFDSPSWSAFPSFRLWTLAGIARDVKPSGKILFVAANLNSGGAQRSLVNLAKELKGKLPFEITIAGKTTTPYFQEELKQSSIKVTQADGSFWNAFTYAENIVHKICSENFGLVCFWNVDARIKFLLVKALGFTRIRFVDVSPGDYIFDEMEEVKEFQRLIAFSHEEYFGRIDSLVLKYDGFVPKGCEKKTTAIPNGILDTLRMKSSYAISGPPRIVVNGRIAETKFILEIIEAMQLLWKKIPQTELHFFGGAEPLHHEYAEKVYAAGHDERIFFHGVDFEAKDKLSKFDAYVVLGKNQGCPNALMEALSVGMPSIGNDDGGTREQLIHNQTGLLIKSTSPAELSDAIYLIITDRELARRLGENGRRHIENNFSMEKMATAYNNLFNELVGEKKCWQEKLTRFIRLKIAGFQRFLRGDAEPQDQTETLPA